MTGKVHAAAKPVPTAQAKPTVHAKPSATTNVLKQPKQPAFKPDEKELQGIAAATRLSPAFLGRIIDFEGFRKTNYHLAVNTIGVGHNIDEEPKFKADLKKGKPIVISDKQIYSFFKADMLKKKAEIRAMLPNFDSLNQGQQEALVDLSFNLIPSALKGSKLAQAVSQNKFDEAVANFDFVKAEGKVLPGLCQRRIYDIGLFASGMHPDGAKRAINDIIEKCDARDDVAIAGQSTIEDLEVAWALKNPRKNPIVASSR